jgi:Leu/Phe-tRNA-protein transferase
MSFWKNSENRVAIVQINNELRNAQVELLSAQCATDRLRLRFSKEDIAQHGQPDVLRKAIASTTALHDYYSAIEKPGSGTSAEIRS